MPKGLILYRDQQLTDEFITMPISQASARLSFDGSEFPLQNVEDGFFIPTLYPLNYLVIESASGSGTTVSSPPSILYGDGFSLANIIDTGTGLNIGAVYCHGGSISGGGTASYEIGAVTFWINGHSYICIGSWANNIFSPLGCFTDNALGEKAYTQQGGPDTPPGSGADAGAGWGAYDFISDNVHGSALPGSSSLPISNDGHGIHAYSITAAAYGVIARALWGEGDVSDGIAVTGDLWQKWQNYKFNPTAGILSCIRLPWCFMPQPTDPDTNVRIAGTYIGIGGTFGAIPGCKPTDCAPKDFTALDVSIPEQYGSWLDYDGGIDITLVLPFCGRISIDPSACVNGRVYVVYRCDVATGNLAAYVYTVDRWGNDQLYQQCTGNCAMQIPLIGHDDGQVAMLGTMVGDAVGVAGSLAAGNAAGAVSGLVGAAQSLLMRRESTQIIGGYAGSVSYIASTRPYLLISYAHPTHSYYYDRTHGRPSEYAADGSTVGSYSGFTIFNDVKIDNLSGAEEEEKAEIRRLLSEGVIL